jgi:hypothetical protein
MSRDVQFHSPTFGTEVLDDLDSLSKSDLNTLVAEIEDELDTVALALKNTVLERQELAYLFMRRKFVKAAQRLVFAAYEERFGATLVAPTESLTVTNVQIEKAKIAAENARRNAEQQAEKRRMTDARLRSRDRQFIDHVQRVLGDYPMIWQQVIGTFTPTEEPAS